MTGVRALTFVVVFLVSGSVASAGDGVSGDLAGLQGTWSGLAGAKKKIAVTIEIRGQAVAVEIKPPVGAKIRARGTIRVDPSSAPKTLDWVGFAGLDGQPLPEVLGIYRLAGDRLRVCTGGPDNPRPAQFEPGEGMLADVFEFSRSREHLADVPSSAFKTD